MQQTDEIKIVELDPIYFFRQTLVNNFRSLNTGLYEVVIVGDRVDRLDTIIDPKGLITPINNVIIDYNHNRLTTGARLVNVEVRKDYAIGGQTLKEALIGQIEVKDTDEAFYFNNKKEKVSAGKLKDMLEKGHLQAVSVDFRPKKQRTTRDGITIFTEWDLSHLSLLDQAPGQAESGIKKIRSLDNNNQEIQKPSMPKLLKQAIADKLVELKIAETAPEITNLEIIAKFDALNGRHEFVAEFNEDYSDVELKEFKTITQVEQENEDIETIRSMKEEITKMYDEMRIMCEEMRGYMTKLNEPKREDDEVGAEKEAEEVKRNLDNVSTSVPQGETEEHSSTDPVDDVSVNLTPEEIRMQLQKYSYRV